jgi:hypothetical protein
VDLPLTADGDCYSLGRSEGVVFEELGRVSILFGSLGR